MLAINIEGGEFYDDMSESFKAVKPTVLHMEHSLASVAKWEAKWHVPFLHDDNLKTPEMWFDYFRCMIIDDEYDVDALSLIDEKQVGLIRDYISDPMTATTIRNEKRGGRAIITNERIYYWMTKLQIPFECENWHLNRLMMLIRVCNAEEAPKKKMGRGAASKQNQALNAARRAKHRSAG